MSCTHLAILSIPGGKVNVLGGHSIGHSKQKSAYVPVFLFWTVSKVELFHCTVCCTDTDEQHTMSSHELQSVLMLTVDYLKMYYVS
jgi:hypothetical protein